jgi:hypothetical protein
MIPSDEKCTECGAKLLWRRVHPYPLKLQILFGLSFASFLLFFDRVSHLKALLALWCVLQVALGVLLIRGRVLARKQELRCIRCGAALP